MCHQWAWTRAGVWVQRTLDNPLDASVLAALACVFLTSRGRSDGEQKYASPRTTNTAYQTTLPCPIAINHARECWVAMRPMRIHCGKEGESGEHDTAHESNLQSEFRVPGVCDKSR
ncbi:hypothetical protein E2C01_102395 [Portunus trituberculatus]|uniref:Uncharacterized protein n=1 Tax=Portunus trituberculatus TaxID=210409 RepID=A0A5B7KIF5_PORTR|nr:hypothetical protein [Portunus trituberculatus]